MKRKSKILLTSLAAIAVATSVIVGSTYALYSSEAGENVVINSGKIKVTSENIITKAWSENGYENATVYEDGTTRHTFSAGGTATLKDNEISLTNMIPMDGIEYEVNFNNESSIEMQYRTRIIVEGDALEKGALKVTLTNKETKEEKDITGPITLNSYKKAKKYTKNLGEYTIKIEMPRENEYQFEGEFKLKFVIEALQPNVVVPMQVGEGLDYATLEEAISNANENDTIEVLNSKEFEDGTGIVINKPITLKGIEGNKLEFSGTSNIQATVPVTIDGLNIVKTDDTKVSLITLTNAASNSVVKNTTLTGTYELNGTQITRAFELSGDLENITLENNTIKNLRQFSYINDNATGTIKNNYVQYTKGMVLVANSNFEILGNRFDNNETDIALIDNDEDPSTAIECGYDSKQLSIDNHAFIDNQVEQENYYNGDEVVMIKENPATKTVLRGSEDPNNPIIYYVPDGTITHSLEINDQSNIVVKGEDDNKSTLFLTGVGSSGQGRFMVQGGATNIVIENLNIDHEKTEKDGNKPGLKISPINGQNQTPEASNPVIVKNSKIKWVNVHGETYKDGEYLYRSKFINCEFTTAGFNPSFQVAAASPILEDCKGIAINTVFKPNDPLYPQPSIIEINGNSQFTSGSAIADKGYFIGTALTEDRYTLTKNDSGQITNFRKK